MADKARLSTLTELSSESVGGCVLSVSDEFFAEASQLLRVQPAHNLKGQFGPKGALYSGWETRRHNPDHDWCIIKLGVPGYIHAFDIDTSHFNGNEAPAASVEALFAEGPGSIKPSDTRWITVLPQTKLGPNAQHLLSAYLDQRQTRFSHVKLTIYPDGGVARFRVYGLVLPVFPEDPNEIFDLALFSSGGRVVQVSDQHFGQGSNLILPGRGYDMGDGWETKRSRVSGHVDWVIMKLGCPGKLDHIEIDTNHFMGNFPESVEVHSASSESDLPKKTVSWIRILPRTKLGPHRRHFFQLENTKEEVFTHLRVTIFPDGGIKRVRVMGIRADTESVESFPVLLPVMASCPPLCAPQREACIAQQHPVIRALPLSHEAFSAFGSVIQAYADANAAPPQVVVTGANQGTAVKFNHVLAKVQASFPKASPEIQAANFAVYRTQPIPPAPIFTVKLLERHPCNNQAFFMIGNGPKLWDDDLNQISNGYLVVVAKNGEDDKPDLASLKAFVASSSQGVLYDPGTWHHPLIALKETTDFACVETQLGGGNELDCEVVDLESPYANVILPGF